MRRHGAPTPPTASPVLFSPPVYDEPFENGTSASEKSDMGVGDPWSRASNLLEFVAAAYAVECGVDDATSGEQPGGAWGPPPGLGEDVEGLREAAGHLREELGGVPAWLEAKIGLCKREAGKIEESGSAEEVRAPGATIGR